MSTENPNSQLDAQSAVYPFAHLSPEETAEMNEWIDMRAKKLDKEPNCLHD